MSEKPNVESVEDAWALFRQHLANRGVLARILLDQGEDREAAQQWQELVEKLRSVMEALPDGQDSVDQMLLEEVLVMVEQGGPANLDAIVEKEHENNPKAESFSQQLVE